MRALRGAWQAVRAVLWGFLGIRSSKGYDEDRNKLKVQYVIAAGIGCAVVFVLLLVVVVKLVTQR